MNTIVLSIIVPVYNNVLIQETLESVRKIKTTNIELLVIDGQSNDGTEEVIKKYLDIIDVYISEKDKGPYDAANKGIIIAKGDWIFWLAADDVLLYSPVDLLQKYNSKDMYDVICGSILKEKADGNTVICKSSSNLYRLKYHCSLRQPATLFRRELFLRTGGYDLSYKYAADREIFLKLKKHGAKFLIVDDCITFFRYGGLTTSKKVIESYKEDSVISQKYGANSIVIKELYYVRVIQFYIKVIINKI